MDVRYAIERNEYKRMRRFYSVIVALLLLAQVPTNAEGLSALWTQYGVSDGVLNTTIGRV